MATLEVRSLSRSFPDETIALRDVSFAVEDGRIAAILGPSGGGKTTSLRLVAGLDEPDAGDVLLDGISVLRVPPHRRGVGLMFQELALFPHMDVQSNVAFGLRMAKWPRERQEARIAELLALLGLSDKRRRRVHELSGGERQRVALARTLAPEPAVLLLDEPLGQLDEALKLSLRHELRTVLKKLRTTALLVTHDLRDAMAIADDLVIMADGRVLQARPLAEVLVKPVSVEVARMLGYQVLLDGERRGLRLVEDGIGSVGLPPEAEIAGRGLALAHPTALLGTPPGSGAGSGVGGVVTRARPDGPTYVLEVALGDRRISARWEWDLDPPPEGEPVDVAVRPGTLRFFPAPDTGPPRPTTRAMLAPRTAALMSGRESPASEDDGDEDGPEEPSELVEWTAPRRRIPAAEGAATAGAEAVGDASNGSARDASHPRMPALD